MSIKKDILWRVGLVYVFPILFIAILIVGQVLRLQIVEGETYREKAKANSFRDITIPADRGNICSCDGRLLASSVPYFQIRMDTYVCPDSIFDRNIDSLSLCLSKFYKDKSKRYYKRRIRKARRAFNRYLLINKKELTYNELKEIKRFQIFRLGKNKGGLIIRQINRRIQPHKNLACRTIGYLSESEYSRLEGRVGLEGAYESELRGKDGVGVKQKMIGKWLPFNVVDPVDGYDLITTIDINFQDVAETVLAKQLKAYDADHGTVVLMDVATGAVRAIANLGKDTVKNTYVEDYNYAVGESVEYGSVFKLASIIALLEDGYVSPQDSLDTGKGKCVFYDRVMKDSHRGGYGKITVKEVFEKSSNVGISTLINKFYGDNPSRYVNRLYSMRLNEPLGLEIKGEGWPRIKYPGDKDWYGTTLPWMSIGYEVNMTPLQILTFFNAVANNGKMVKPNFVKELRYRGKVVKKFEEEVLSSKICSDRTLEVVHDMLEGVIERGTAKNIKSKEYKIAGKTGTALIADRNKGYKSKIYRASFVGYFPADNPMFSCIVAISNPDRSKGIYGSTVAAPVFKAISDKVYAMTYSMHPLVEIKENDNKVPDFNNGFKKDLNKIAKEFGFKVQNRYNNSDWVKVGSGKSCIDYKEIKVSGNKVPDVRGMGLKDALFLLENIGLKVRCKGVGTIKRQSLKPGTRIKRGYIIYLVLT